jgi:lipid-binding SYLF domain-containing protein
MKTSLITLLLIVVSTTLFSQENDVDEANEAINNFKDTNSEIEKFFDSAYGYAVFPGIGKGGLGIGGAAGKGTIYQGGAPVADTKMTQLTVGLQAGGQKYAEVIFFEDENAYNRFISDKFEFAAQVSAVALKSGVSLDAKYTDGMLVFTIPIGGLMYEASIGGQKFKTEMY